MTPVIKPKSDQLNTDDLIGGPRTIRITRVTIAGSEQPVSVHFEGDNNKPWKPCKSMCRLLVAAWGPDASVYAGRSVTLFRDPSVLWAGLEVGGIRISHMSHIERDMLIALTVTRGKRAPYTVKMLPASQPKRTAPATDPDVERELAMLVAAYEVAPTTASVMTLEESRKQLWSKLNGAQKRQAKEVADAAITRVRSAEAEAEQDDSEPTADRGDAWEEAS